jgi:hypothetical protein
VAELTPVSESFRIGRAVRERAGMGTIRVAWRNLEKKIWRLAQRIERRSTWNEGANAAWARVREGVAVARVRLAA